MYVYRIGLPTAVFAAALLSLPAATPFAASASKSKTQTAALATTRQPIVDTTSWPKAAGPNGTVCFADHFHYGTSRDQANKEAALRIASNAWSEFVVFEYGKIYADLSLAQSVTSNCARTGGAWSCTVQALPCRHGG